MEVPDDDQTSSQTETSEERHNDDETSSKDTLTPECSSGIRSVSMDELNTAALEVNSADEIRYLHNLSFLSKLVLCWNIGLL